MLFFRAIYRISICSKLRFTDLQTYEKSLSNFSTKIFLNLHGNKVKISFLWLFSLSQGLVVFNIELYFDPSHSDREINEKKLKTKMENKRFINFIVICSKHSKRNQLSNQKKKIGKCRLKILLPKVQ